MLDAQGRLMINMIDSFLTDDYKEHTHAHNICEAFLRNKEIFSHSQFQTYSFKYSLFKMNFKIVLQKCGFITESFLLKNTAMTYLVLW